MADRTCIVEGCGRGGKLTRGMCTKDYRYWLDHTPVAERGPAPRTARNFWDYVTKRHEQGCWTWTTPRLRGGYGLWGRKLAHRHSWELANGPIPDGLWVLHHCDNKPCVNPAHLYLGTRVENMQDAVERGRMHSPRQVTCRAGHAKEGENLVVVESRGYKSYRCRRCDNERKAASARAARRAQGPLLRHPVSTEERDRVLTLRQGGAAHRTIAREVGRSLMTVQRILKEAGR